MLKENPEARRDLSEGYRRWFGDDFFELIVWFEDERQKTVNGFQLVYDAKSNNSRVLSWNSNEGFFHQRVDEGEDSPMANRSPTLIEDAGEFPFYVVMKRLEEERGELDVDHAFFIFNRLREYAQKRIELPSREVQQRSLQREREILQKFGSEESGLGRLRPRTRGQWLVFLGLLISLTLLVSSIGYFVVSQLSTQGDEAENDATRYFRVPKKTFQEFKEWQKQQKSSE